jgi:hypothetical protein
MMMRRRSLALAALVVAALALAAAPAARAAVSDGAAKTVTVPGEFTDAAGPVSAEYEPSQYEYEVMPEGYVPQPGEVVYEYDPKMFESADAGKAAAAGGAFPSLSLLLSLFFVRACALFFSFFLFARAFFFFSCFVSRSSTNQPPPFAFL